MRYKVAFAGVTSPGKNRLFASQAVAAGLNLVHSRLFSSDIAIFFELRPKDLAKSWALRLFRPECKLFLFALEPRVVLPFNYRWWVSHFDATFYPGRAVTNEVNGHLLNWPADGLENFETKPSPGKGIALVNSNQFSAVPSSLYELRYAAAKEWPDLTLAGNKWEMPRFRKLMTALKAIAMAVLALERPRLLTGLVWALRPPGENTAVQDKQEFFRHYRFALVIENSLEYYSEKVFDAIRAGLIPIYVGAPLPPEIEELVFRAPAEISGMREVLELAKKADTKLWNRERLSFLESEEVSHWSSESVISSFWILVIAYMKDQEANK